VKPYRWAGGLRGRRKEGRKGEGVKGE